MSRTVTCVLCTQPACSAITYSDSAGTVAVCKRHLRAAIDALMADGNYKLTVGPLEETAR